MRLKSIFDYLLAVILSVILIFPFLFLWTITSIDTKANGLFKQKRIGKNGSPFLLYKLRTMKGNPISSITTTKTHQITQLGQILRQTRLDEIPQLLNVLNGTMSFVGPRPDVSGYADKLQGDDRIILTVKPGITGPAQLKYKNESQLLAQQESPQKYNDQIIWPDKVKINKEYVTNHTFKKDLYYLWKTII